MIITQGIRLAWGKWADTAATKIQSINTAWQKFKTGLVRPRKNERFQGLLNWVSDLVR